MLTGSLEWSLPPQVVHKAGGLLPVTFRLANPANAPRSYQIFLALFDPATGSVMADASGPLAINGVNTFEVEANSELTLAASLQIDYSDAVLQAALYDTESGEMAVGLQTRLESPAGIGDPVAPIAGFVSGVLALGLVTDMVIKATARR